MRVKQISTFSENNRNRTSLLPYLSLIIIGVIIGSFMNGRSFFSNSTFIEQCFIPSDNNTSVFILIKETFLWAMIFTVCAFCIGLCAFGIIPGVILLLYRGAGIGMSISCIYTDYGRASLFPAAAVIPKAAAFSVIAAMSVRESFKFSRGILNYCIKGDICADKAGSFRLYCVKFIVLIILSLFISAADGGLNYILAKVIQQ